MSQNSIILRHLKQKGSITARYAALQYGVWRLSARICQLRGKGNNIKTIMHETETSPTGDWAEYRLVKEADNE